MQHLYPVFTGLSLSEIDTVAIRAYIRQRQATDAAASTINKEIGLFSSAINYAPEEWGWQLVNPVDRIRLEEPVGRMRWLSRGEAQALIRAASDEPRASDLPDFIRLARDPARPHDRSEH